MEKKYIKLAEELVNKMTLGEKISQMRYDSPAIERLGVPAYNWWNECLHGVARSGRATVFPQAIGMAASFNEELMFDVANAISDEARAKYNQYKKFGDTEIYQGLTYWSPNINIFRDPRWGRGHETYGEDVLLTSRMGTSFIKGLQEGKNPDPNYRKLDATIKHFAAHSGPEAIRHGFNAVVSDKDLYEIYFEAFRYCIENADPSAVMGAYNAINGEPCCGSRRLIKDILETELGFDGYFVSDCGAVCDIDQHHHTTENAAESAALAVNSGCILNCGSAFRHLQAAVADGLVSEETITNACIKLFSTRFRLGMFANDCSYDKIPYDIVECKAHRDLNRRIAQESMVLLKNNGILPLKNTAGLKIAVIGPNADNKNILLGNYNGTPSRYKTLLGGLTDMADELNAEIIYAYGCHIFDETVHDWAEHPEREAIIAAQQADIVIMCMGLDPSMEGEEGDAYNGAMSGDKKDLDLPDSQQKLFEAVYNAGKPVIFVNVSGSCINLCRQEETCAAIIQCFYPGAEGGNALADIVFGKVSPSGRLPVTFYRNADKLPDFTDYSMKNRTYRFCKDNILYSFGYGMTYSEIEEKWHDNIVEISNNGEYDTFYTILKFNETDGKLTDFRKIWIEAGQKTLINFK